MAEIGDVTRFTHRGVLTAFAGVDSGKNDSGQHLQKSVRTSKKGSPSLRKTLFRIMDGLIKHSPADDAVYVFMDKKRAQGKPYYVYVTASANKFLRIYYGRVREYLASLEQASAGEGIPMEYKTYPCEIHFQYLVRKGLPDIAGFQSEKVALDYALSIGGAVV